MHHFRWGFRSGWWVPCSSSQKSLRRRQKSLRLLRALKPMAWMEVERCLITKGLRQNRFRGKERKKSGHQTNTRCKQKVQFPTKVAPKEENHPMLHTKNGFMVLNQTMFVSQTKYWKLDLWYQTKSCLCCGRNARNWFYDTKPNHMCRRWNVKSWLCGPSLIMSLPQTEC